MTTLQQILDEFDKIIDSWSQSADFDCDYDGKVRAELKDFLTTKITD